MTPGVFMRMYNRVSVKGPLAVFNIEHINWNLPLTLKNYDCKPCSVLGIKKVKAADQCDDTLEGGTDEYVYASYLEKFNSRYDEVVFSGKGVKEEDYRKRMSFREFCDRFNTNSKLDRDTGESHLLLTSRGESYNDITRAVRLVPHLTKARANPKASKHWLYCMHLTRWLTPCETMSDLEPESPLEGKELQDHWIGLYQSMFKNPNINIPKWAQRHYDRYCGDSMSSDEEDNADDFQGNENNLVREIELGFSDDSSDEE